MKHSRSFRFLDEQMNRHLIRLLKKSEINHLVDGTGLIRYSEEDAEAVENRLMDLVRTERFSSWQVLTCPRECVRLYKDYMTEHNVPFTEELANGELWFLMPGSYRPHSWKLDTSPLDRQKANRVPSRAAKNGRLKKCPV